MRVAISAGMAVVLAACSPHTVSHAPAPRIAVPTAYLAGTGEAPPQRWWRAFQDPALDALVEATLEQNLQLRAAWARVRQARHLVAQANSGKWPQVELSASASRRKSRFALGEPIGEITPTNNTFSVSVGAAYELDLWRRVANQADAALLDAIAVRADVESIAISLTAEVAEAWFDLVYQNAQRQLIEEQLETNETYLELTKLRFRQGLASALDVYQQEQQLVSTRSQLRLIDMATALNRHRLALLLGQAPGALPAEAPAELPTLPEIPGTGLPADLLERRPDVRAARLRVEAADYRIAVAIADRLPSLRLSGDISEQSSTIGDLLRTPLWGIMASLTAPLLDGGRRKAEVERSRDVLDERAWTYAQALLQAIVEVENAMVQERQQVLYLEELEEQMELLDKTLTEARARYRQGLIDYLPVLSALQAQQRAQLNVLQARRQLLSYRVQLCRALGGTWTRELEAAERGSDAS